MSAFGAGIGRAVGSLGGPQVVAIVVVGGLVAGAIGGGILGGGGSGKPATSSASLSIYPCPDSGPALASVGSGQKFLVTGKNGDASWVRIYYPLPGRTEAWVTSGPLKVDGSLNDVPVVPCSPVEAGPGASVGPGASLTAIEDNSPSPAAPSPSAGPTVSPDGGPTLARLATGPSIAGGPQRYCSNAARSVTVSVRATDRTGVDGVVLSYRKPGSATFVTKPMTKAGADTWRATLATDADGISGPGSLRVFVTATDTDPRPHTTRLPADTTRSIAVVDCANEGPTLASVRTNPGAVFTNIAACDTRPKTTTVSLTAKDVDGVDAVTLHYRLPGDSAFRDKPMAKNGSSWRATVTPVDQRPNADGKVTYYVTGKDALGESTRSATQSFTANRCNFPADFGSVNFDVPQGCASGTTLFANIARATDRDGLTAASAKVVYTFTPKGKSQRTGKKSLAQTQVIGDEHFYSGQVNFTNLEPNSIVSVYATLTDKYGVTNKDLQDSFKFQAKASC